MTWAPEIADAQAGIREGGRGYTATLLKPGSETGPTHNPTRGAATSHSCFVVAFDYGETQIDGTLVQRGDRRLMVSSEGLSVAPEPGDGFTLDGISWHVVSVMPVSPGGSVIYWKVQIRGK